MQLRLKIALLAIFTFLMLFGTVGVTFAKTTYATTKSWSILTMGTTDDHDNSKSSFNQDDPIRYKIWVNNMSGSTMSFSIHYEVWLTSDRLNGEIRDNIVHGVQVLPGLQNVYDQTIIPDSAFTGGYTFHAYVYNEADYPQDFDQQQTTFSAKGVLDVPYTSQFQHQNSASEDCGPASVAMVLAYYSKGPGLDKQGIYAIRGKTGKPDNMGTNYLDLEKALRAYKQKKFSEIFQSKNTPDAAAATKAMKNAIAKGKPVIAFIDGTVLGRSYVGHWLVVTGFSKDGSMTVYVNDPDSDFSGGYPGHPTTLSVSVFQTAGYSGIKKEKQPYGIIIG